MTQRNDPLVPKPDASGDGDDDKMTLSMMGGVGKPESMPEPADLDLESMKGSGKTINQGTLVILLVFAIAAGTLYLMRHTQTDLGAGALPADLAAKIERELAKQAQPDAVAANDPMRKGNMEAMFHDTESIVNMFSDDMTRRQVPIEMVKQNPFVLSIAGHTIDPHDMAPRVSAKERMDHLLTLVKTMKLQSVMLGKMPVAVIDGKFYRAGEAVGPFVIQDIGQRQVTLVADGVAFPLTMTQEPGAKP